MNADYITRALCFHGKPMQKIWEDERGVGDLQNLGIASDPSFTIYQERQKHFTFQDRAKRLKLHQFIARKSTDLYDVDLKGHTEAANKNMKESLEKAKQIVAVMPPFEIFLNKKPDKQTRWRYALEAIKPGDVIYGVVTRPNSSMSTTPMIIKPLCTGEPLVRYLSDVPIKAYVNANKMGSMPVDKRGNQRCYVVNDYICCEVVEVSVDADRISLGLERNLADKNVHLGLISGEDLPLYYRKTMMNSCDNYEECLKKSKEILNPNYDMLFEVNGLDPRDNFTLMSSLKYPFPTQDYAKELRQTQASKWAFRSVAEGIERFKLGLHVEAFQCLNKALNIDPHNVEGLVARGALYANKGSFVKAVDDFEKALKLNSYHVNARKYMGETLVALGRSYEDENRIPEAAKAYRDCLNIIANHEQARISLEAIQHRTGSYFFDNYNVTATDADEMRPTSTMAAEEIGTIGPMPTRSGAGMLNPVKPTSSPSTSPTVNSSSRSSDNDSLGADAHHPKHRQPSLSPLSKRMALHDASLRAAHSGMPSQPADGAFTQPYYDTVTDTTKPIDFKVTQLDDDDTEKRVRRLLIEASKHKKEKTLKSRQEKDEGRDRKNSRNHRTNGAFGIMNAVESVILDDRSSSPTPKAPSMRLPDEDSHKASSGTSRSFSRFSAAGPAASGTPIGTGPAASSAISPAAPVNPSSTLNSSATAQSTSVARLSFPLKKPVKIDKFGLVRIATPLVLNSPSPPTRSLSRSPRSRSRSRSRRRSRVQHASPSPGGGRRRGSRRRSSSSDRGRRRSRSRQRPRQRARRRNHATSRSRSYSRSRSRTRSPRRRGGRSLHGSGGRRRSPSPFVPRDSSPGKRRRRSKSVEYTKGGRRASRSPRGRAETAASGVGPKFRNRVWQRPGYTQPPNSGDPSARGGSREKDREERKKDSAAASRRRSRDRYEDPSIEEIDELINKAHKERIEEIIKRDKEIVKKTTA